MFEQKYFGLPIWIWIIVVGIIVFSCYKTISSSNSISQKQETPTETKESFAEVSKPKIKVLNFNTSWCGWSKRFQPEWDSFSSRVKSDPKLSHVEAVDVKCDDKKNEAMCEQYQVPGYPYVVIEVDGKRTQYNGERTADALVEYCLQ